MKGKISHGSGVKNTCETEAQIMQARKQSSYTAAVNIYR
jgi:hypothetical protein